MRPCPAATPFSSTMAKRFAARATVLSKYSNYHANTNHKWLSNINANVNNSMNLLHISSRCITCSTHPLSSSHASHDLHSNNAIDPINTAILSFSTQKSSKSIKTAYTATSKSPRTLKMDSKESKKSSKSTLNAKQTNSNDGDNSKTSESSDGSKTASASAKSNNESEGSKDDGNEDDNDNNDNNENNKDKDKDKDSENISFNIDLKNVYKKMGNYTPKTFSTSTANKSNEEVDEIKKEYMEKHQQVLDAKEKAKAKKVEFSSKLELFRESNNFEISYFNGQYWFDYWMIKLRDMSFGYFMNAWFTQFSERFVSYDEFLIGSIDGFKFICESLVNDDYDDIRDCVSDEIYDHRLQLKEAMLGDDEIYKIMPYIHDVKTIRQQLDMSNINENNYSESLAKAPIRIIFVVRYYYCLKPKSIDVLTENESSYIKNQRYAEFTWSSSWQAKTDNILTFEMEQDWMVENIDITSMKVENTENEKDGTESTDATSDESIESTQQNNKDDNQDDKK